MVALLSLALGRVLADITAGTEQPKPMSIGTMLRPERPIFLKKASQTKAILAIYPLSSSIDRKKKRTIIIGIKLSTLPTPPKMASTTRERSIPLTFQDSKSESTVAPRAAIPSERSP